MAQFRDPPLISESSSPRSISRREALVLDPSHLAAYVCSPKRCIACIAWKRLRACKPNGGAAAARHGDALPR